MLVDCVVTSVLDELSLEYESIQVSRVAFACQVKGFGSIAASMCFFRNSGEVASSPTKL